MADETGLPLVPRTSRRGQWNEYAHGFFASAALTGPRLAIEKTTMMIRYGAYARATSAPLSRPVRSPVVSGGSARSPGAPPSTSPAMYPPPAEPLARCAPARSPPPAMASCSACRSGDSTGRHTRTSRTTARADTSEAMMSVSGTET